MDNIVKEVSPDGTVWWIDEERDCLHRTDGPAVEWAGGGETWYFDGNRHRCDGPAVVHRNGNKEWFIENQRVPVKNNIEFFAWLCEND